MKLNNFFNIIFSSLCLYLNVKFVDLDRILGCNGFIKSNIKIDFSKVEVKLISDEGNLKDRIECAPNNGYFFLPIYDKGDYTLQISSVYKWAFDPQEVKISFDGVTDICSAGKDIIFTFKGFRVFGKVVSVGGRKGPKGVLITLVADLPTEQKEIYSISTGENGFFDISPVLPGSYILKASHDRWRISKGLTTFKIENGNYEVQPKSLLFTGYDVSGSVVSNGEPIDGVHFILFSDAGTTVDISWLIGCNSSIVNAFEILDVKMSNAKQLCHIVSDYKGQFLLPSVPSGHYIIVPFYKGVNSLKFDVQPKLVSFSVLQDSFVFSKPFQVSGFTVLGRVISQPINGRPLSGLKIIFDKEKNTETNKDGVFRFEGIKTGLHHIKIKGNDFLFSDVELKISPNSAILDDIHPNSFKISGTVKKLQSLEIIIKFTQENGQVIELPTDKNGDFSVFLNAKSYNVSVSPVGTHPEKLLWFYPKKFELKIIDKPIKNVNFQQKTAQLIGSVECIDDNLCDEINVILRSSDSEDEYHKVTEGGKYEFMELYPGYYDLNVLNGENWCWEYNSQKIFISEIYNTAPTFKRIGISFAVSSSHDTSLKYKKLSLNKTVLKEGVLDIKQGIHQYCLPGVAVYQLEPIGCHWYAESVMRWEAGQDSLMLMAVSHEITASIVSAELVDDLYINMYSDDNSTLKARIGPLKSSINKQSQYVYGFQFQAEHNEKLILIPESSSLLFNPSSLNVHGFNDCVKLEQHIVAKKGIRLSGHVEPPLENVKISILNDVNEVLVSTFTDVGGKYKFIPLHSDYEYKLVGEKEGYVLTGPFETGLFRAHKLAEIQISLLDDEEKALPGVLLSLSGGENYRQTSQSNADGRIIFLSLKPSEYYLRPMLKEYKFSPPSKVIRIKEGETVEVTFTGHRVLYSIFGSVYSLNRIPEREVVIEAVSKAEEECVQHQEEGTTDDNGLFRIRGLQPQCGYDVRLKKAASINRHIYKTIPDNTYIKMNATDLQDVNFIAVLEALECDVFVYIILGNAEHLRTLKLKLFDDDGNIIQTIKLNEWKTSRYSLKSVLLPISGLPLNYKNYYIQLESTLSKSAYTFVLQTIHFTANSTFRLLKMTFKPELKLSDSEVKHSYTAAICITLLALAYWRRDSIIIVLSQLQNNSRVTVLEFLNKYSQQPKNKENERTFIEFEPGLTVVKRKLKPRKM